MVLLISYYKILLILVIFIENLYCDVILFRIRQTGKPAQGRDMEKGRSTGILPSVGHLQLITTLKKLLTVVSYANIS